MVSSGGHPEDGGVGAADLHPNEPDAVEELLIADLREAFGGEGRPASLGASLSSSVGAGPLHAADALPAHSRLGDFEILHELGRGGMGVVYRARQISLGREVALKVLPSYARHGHIAVERFRSEAQAAARLHHTNIVSIYAQGEYQGHYFYAMELVDGISLDVVIRARPDLLSTTAGRSTRPRAAEASSAAGLGEQRGAATITAPYDVATGHTALLPQAPETVDRTALPAWTRADYRHLAALFAEVAEALACAHRHGVIHRDVKPHNLLLGTGEAEGPGAPGAAPVQRLHLTDFGLARLTDAPHLTVSGEVMGTPAYLSPEQVRGHPAGIDHRTDIYSLGVTLYEVLTRRKPFEGDSRDLIMSGIATREPVAPRQLNPHIPLDLETICLRAMEKDPARRHSTAALLADDLRRFAEGRPILSRRTSRFEKAAKWVRRHQALTLALAATGAVVALAAGWAWSWGAARQAEAERLLDRAYEQLAYFDYRKPELVAREVARAADLGADPERLALVQGLMAMGANDPATAAARFQAALQRDDTNIGAWYLLAWAQARNRQEDAARATLAEVQRRGLPTAADAWFFRGLAIHAREPQAAAEAYAAANAARAREHAFYPQAVLHLARARNQQLYATRRLEVFPQVEASLRQLIAERYYEAYPYYLLSIAHRLAAEIYQGAGTRDDAPVQEHYAQALALSQEGQAVDPRDDRPIAAEAECLESMGRFAEAIAARTRALAVADADVKRCESYHYRWRLYYWTGDLDAAAADLAAHAACDPQSRFYAHVYPALLAAERGDVSAARAHARALAHEAPRDAQAVVWSATCLRLFGAPDEAAALLTERRDGVDFGAGLTPPQTAEWVQALYAYCEAGGALDALEMLAASSSSPWKLWGEAYFHAAALRLAQGDRSGAEEWFRHAYRASDGEERYTYHAKLIVVQMEKSLAWPAWLQVSWEEAPGRSQNDKLDRPVAPAPQGEERANDD